jgi:hypothetical protein
MPTLVTRTIITQRSTQGKARATSRDDEDITSVETNSPIKAAPTTHQKAQEVKSTKKGKFVKSVSNPKRRIFDPEETNEEDSTTNLIQTNKPAAVKQRINNPVQPTTTNVTQQETKKKKKKIAKNEYDADAELAMDHVKSLFGDEAKRTKPEDFQTKYDEIDLLKQEVSAFMQVMIERKVVYIARKDPNIKKPRIKDLQILWQRIPSQNAEDAKKTKKSFWNMTQPGSNKFFKKHWDLEMEAAYMEQQGLEYKKDKTLNNKKGCIARSATRAIRNVRKKLFAKAKGKKGHQLILSSCSTGVPGKKQKTLLRRKHLVFKESYVRKSLRASASKDKANGSVDSGIEEGMDGDSNRESKEESEMESSDDENGDDESGDDDSRDNESGDDESGDDESDECEGENVEDEETRLELETKKPAATSCKQQKLEKTMASKASINIM